jgi:hypothetical protein
MASRTWKRREGGEKQKPETVFGPTISSLSKQVQLRTLRLAIAPLLTPQHSAVASDRAALLVSLLILCHKPIVGLAVEKGCIGQGLDLCLGGTLIQYAFSY